MESRLESSFGPRGGAPRWVRLPAVLVLGCAVLSGPAWSQSPVLATPGPPTSGSGGVGPAGAGQRQAIELLRALWPTGAMIEAAKAGRRPGFGVAVAVSGGTAFIGAPGATSDGVKRGAVKAFGRSVRPFGLAAPGLSDGARFGAALAAGGGWLAVGAPRATGEAGELAGAVLLYDAQEVLVARLEPDRGQDGASFGAALAIQKGAGSSRPVRLAVGAPQATVSRGVGPVAAGEQVEFAGEVHVFEACAGGWRRVHVLQSPRPAIAATFGAAVAFVGETLVVGAPGDPTSGPGSGRAFGFGSAGDLVFEVGPAGGAAGSAHGARYGAVVSTLAGGPGKKRFAVSAPGRAVVETFSVHLGAARFEARAQGSVVHGFGSALADARGQLLVGAPWTPSGSGGVVIVFARDGQAWRRSQTLRPPVLSPVGQAAGEFGLSIAWDAAPELGDLDTVVVGAPWSSAPCGGGECGAGSAFAYSVTDTP